MSQLKALPSDIVIMTWQIFTQTFPKRTVKNGNYCRTSNKSISLVSKTLIPQPTREKMNRSK